MPKVKRTPRRVRKMERRKLARTKRLMAAMDQAVNADAPRLRTETVFTMPYVSHG